MKKYIIFALVFQALFVSLWAQAAPTPLTIDHAFALSTITKNSETVVLRWQIAPGYYLYRDHFKIDAINPHDVVLASPVLPANYIKKTIPTLGLFDVYEHSVVIIQPILQSVHSKITLVVHYQGCALQGFCYPPVSKTIAITLPHPVHNTAQKTQLSPLYQEIPRIMISFFVFGVLISLTPCVLPMLPILLSIIVGQKKLSKKHTFFLALAYVLGMALTYAIAGIITVLVGINLQTAFQQPWLIILATLVFVVMALSLWDVYQLQLPVSWQTKLAQATDRQTQGSLIGTFLMGVLSTLLLSPCVTPALVMALTYISQTKHLINGGLGLFCLGLGQGFPLLLIGLFGAKYLPKSGKWMIIIKRVMGLLMLAVAVWMISRLLPSMSAEPELPFISVKSNHDLDRQLSSARALDKPVLLDFYAAWCASCKEMDVFTFSNSRVQAALKNTLLLRADVTHNTADDQALQRRFGVIAPPSIIFFDKNHRELSQKTIIGTVSATQFLSHLSHIETRE